MVIAFMMDSLGHDFYEAADIVCEKRAVVCPNLGFIQQLQLYQELGFKLQGNSSAHEKYFALNNRSDLVDARDEFIGSDDDELSDIRRFMRKLPLDAELAGLGAPRCKHCNKLLASGTDVAKHGKPGEEHSHVFLAPMEWMFDFVATEATGELFCPHDGCGKPIGQYDWSPDSKTPRQPQCACGYISKPAAFGLEL